MNDAKNDTWSPITWRGCWWMTKTRRTARQFARLRGWDKFHR